MNLFDFSLRLNGYPLDKAKIELAHIQQKNDNDYKAFIDDKLKTIVEYHLKHNTFYKSLAPHANSKSWSSIPVMTKKDLQQPLHERLSNGFTTKNVYVNKTSGSSGDPFIFAKDKFSHALTWAVIQNRFGWYGLDFNTSQQARFYGIPLDKKGYYKERFKDKLSKRYRFSVFDLSDEAFNSHLQKFKSTSFEYINGYTSSIVQFAKFLERQSICLTTICPTLSACVVTSEMLFDKDKKLMEQQFGVPVINEYGASELDLIAFQNTNNDWQLNSETLYVEILDENDVILPYGEEGRIVITSLYNKAHPFIRYDIGDIGVISKKSTLKTPLLKTLIGRTNDIAILPSGKKAAGLTFYYITKSIIEDDGNVKEFVIEQLEPHLFKVIYVSLTTLSEEKKNTITQEMERYLENGLTIRFEKQHTLKRSKSGKLKQFTSHVTSNS
ncbi:phenylacetate--CoA ligase family protein [Psychroserpens damuponensis]|uniref:phenylacetate--CoA ligase family protein n=1 Tax=Psychroserpens damuponensis TaxID=943936 RepID=UPI00058BFF0B|nr:phenylacetate--CoA ligase family protein [Psychroserpens damuponensis]